MKTYITLKTYLVNTCLVIILSLFIRPVIAFSQNFDSLKQNIELARETKIDSVLCKSYLDLAFEYYYYSVDSLDQLIVTAEKAQVVAIKTKNLTRQITSMNLIAYSLQTKGEFDKGIIQYEKIIALAEQNGMILRASQIKDNLANVYVLMNELDQALKLKLEALEVFKKLGNNKSQSICYGGLGSIYIRKGNWQESLVNLKKAVDLLKLEKPGHSLANSVGNIAISYKGLGELDSALHYFLECRSLSKNSQYLYNNNEAELGKFYMENNELEKAEIVFQDLLEAYDENSLDIGYQYYIVQLANLNVKKENYKTAQSFIDRVDTSIINGSVSEEMELRKVSYEISKGLGNYRAALGHYVGLTNLNDSINSIDRNTSFKNIESKYKLVEKEKLIYEQEAKLRMNSMYIIGLMVLLLFSSLLFYQRYKKNKIRNELISQKSELQKQEIENLKKENKIVSMQSLLEGQEEERTRIARDLHDNIGTLMATIKMKVLSIQNETEDLENKNTTIELDEMITHASMELRKISHRMTPTALEISGVEGAILDLGQQLSQNNIEFRTQLRGLESITNKMLAINVYRIVQELVNNIIKHSKASSISIDASTHEANLVLRVRDNGIGLEEEVWNRKQGVGLNNISSRVEYLNGTIKLIEDIGTHFKITIPL